MRSPSASHIGSYPSAADMSGSVTAIWPASDGIRRDPEAVFCVDVAVVERDAAADRMVIEPIVYTSIACDQAANGTWGDFCCVGSVLSSVHNVAFLSSLPPSNVS